MLVANEVAALITFKLGSVHWVLLSSNLSVKIPVHYQEKDWVMLRVIVQVRVEIETSALPSHLGSIPGDMDGHLTL